LPGQTPQDRPDIVARVYHAKLIDFHDFVIKKGFFLERLQPGHTSLSFRREVYHMNIFLLIMENGSKLSGPDDFDKYISAELPDEKISSSPRDCLQTHDAWSLWSS